VLGIDLADKKQAAALTDHDSRVLARKQMICRAWQLGPLLDWATEQAQAAGYESITVACEATGHRWQVLQQLAAERGLEHMGWATIITARSAIEARVMVTRRMTVLTIQGRPLHQIGLPYHWGANGLSTGDSANDLAHLALDPNVHIQEVKALACDIRAGRRPRGPALRELVREYARRAGITDDTGTEM